MAIVFSTFPKTERPHPIALEVVEAFTKHHKEISTLDLNKGLASDAALQIIRPELESIGFQVEKSKKKSDKIHLPVFFGDNGIPAVSYEIDAYHPEYNCGLELEAGRAWMGNAVYRDLIRSLVMVDLEHLIIAVPQSYKYFTNGKASCSNDYANCRNLIEMLFSQRRFTFPYKITLIGY